MVPQAFEDGVDDGGSEGDAGGEEGRREDGGGAGVREDEVGDEGDRRRVAIGRAESGGGGGGGCDRRWIRSGRGHQLVNWPWAGFWTLLNRFGPAEFGLF